jgi:hypothetical protein
MVLPVQFEFSLYVFPLFIIFSARVGHSETQRWQFTHFASSQTILLLLSRYSCALFAHWRSQARQVMHLS